VQLRDLICGPAPSPSAAGKDGRLGGFHFTPMRFDCWSAVSPMCAVRKGYRCLAAMTNDHRYWSVLIWPLLVDR
jgi:hypothetical protein